jgi:hypothetical protein
VSIPQAISEAAKQVRAAGKTFPANYDPKAGTATATTQPNGRAFKGAFRK